jgi:tetratricopeptide (TPR) repeat protein
MLLVEEGRVLRHRGRTPAAWRRYVEAEALARECGDVVGLLRTTLEKAEILRLRGRLDRAEALYRALLADAEAAGDALHMGRACTGLGICKLNSSDPQSAAHWFERARQYLVRSGHRAGIAEVQNHLGELARLRGDLDAAERHYRASASTYRAMGAWLVVIPEANRGVVRLVQGRYHEARPLLEAAYESYRTQGGGTGMATFGALLLPCVVAARDWPAFDRRLDEVTIGLRETGVAENDVAFALNIACDLLADAGELLRAAMTAEVAAAQMLRLGRSDDAARAADRAADLRLRHGARSGTR